MAEFDDWYVKVPFETEAVRVLCCPEDRVCTPECLQGDTLCAHCQVPVCSHCIACVTSKPATQPPAALSNDMMIFYAPKEIYEGGGLTVMELICASPCITTMICFSMEVKYGNKFDEAVHMSRHRMGARGNATTFLLPWDSVLLELQRLDDDATAQGAGPDVPRSGSDLAHVV